LGNNPEKNKEKFLALSITLTNWTFLRMTELGTAEEKAAIERDFARAQTYLV